MVLTHEGDVLTWGHRVSTPSKVQLHNRRDTARSEKALKVLLVRTALGTPPPPPPPPGLRAHAELTRRVLAGCDITEGISGAQRSKLLPPG